MTNYITAAAIQQFSITIASGSTTGTVNLPTAVGAGAFITYGGSNPSVTTDFAEAGAYLSWATAAGTTTITATRNTGTTGTVVITGSITDGDTTNLIKAVQQGTVSITAGTSGTAAVTAPSADVNAALHHLGNTGTGTTLAADIDYGVLTQSGTTVTATYPAAGTTVTGFCLIEFIAACMTANAVQRVSATSSSSVTSWTASLGANVVLNNSLSFWGGKSIATITTADNSSMMYGVLSAVGTFTAHVNTGAADAKIFNASIAEFNSGVLNSAVQRGTTTLTGVVTNNTPITAVNETYSGVSWIGNSTTAGTAQLGESTGAAALGTALGTALPGPALTTSVANDFIISTARNQATGSLSTVNSPYTKDAGSFSGYHALSGTVSAEVCTFNWSVGVTYAASAVALKAAGGGSATFVQSVGNGGSGSTTMAVTIAATVAGNTLCVPISWEGTGITVSGVTDNKSQTWVQVPSARATDSTSTSVTDIWYFPNTASGVTTVTITFSSSATNFACTVYEVNNVNTASAIDTQGIINNGSVTVDAVIVTKATATANITGSWEVFEFPAYIAPAAGQLFLYPFLNGLSTGGPFFANPIG